MKWNLNYRGKGIKYFIGVCVKSKVCHVDIAYDVAANDADFIESYLIGCIIKEWIWEQMKQNKAFLAPAASLKINQERVKRFYKMLEQSLWKLTDLRSSLGVKLNRFSST